MRKPRWILPVILAAAWMTAAVSGWPSRRAMPPLRVFVESAAHELRGAAIFLDIGATLARVLGGLALAIPLGAAFGIALGRRRATWVAIEPALDFLRAIPPILTFPLFLLAFGYGELSRVACIATSAAGLIALHVGDGLSRAPGERAETVSLAGLRPLDALVVLHLYESVPGLVTGTRVAVTTALVIAIVSEMLVGATQGLGARALDAMLSYRPEVLWLVIAITGAIGYALAGALSALERRFVHWR